MSAMLSSVLFFGLLTAAVEFMLLYKFMPLNWLRNRGVQGVLHFGVAALNLAIHWGTIVGTMTAITTGVKTHMGAIGVSAGSVA